VELNSKLVILNKQDFKKKCESLTHLHQMIYISDLFKKIIKYLLFNFNKNKPRPTNLNTNQRQVLEKVLSNCRCVNV